MPFSFQLQNCPPSSAVTFVFSGKKDKQDSSLLAINEGKCCECGEVNLDSGGGPWIGNDSLRQKPGCRWPDAKARNCE